MVEPAKYMTIFERGIDPHVDDPEHCHRHSEVPEKDEDWPVLGEVLGFRDRVRELVVKTIREMEKGERPITRRMVRTLVMMHEHEGFHIEVCIFSSLIHIIGANMDLHRCRHFCTCSSSALARALFHLPASQFPPGLSFHPNGIAPLFLPHIP